MIKMRLLCVCERQILEKCLLTRDGETERKIHQLMSTEEVA